MIKKMIAPDLNGTLLRSDNTISDYIIETIKKVQNKGHKVIITTGRPYRIVLEHYHRLELSTPMISFNGLLTHLPEKKWKWEHSVTIDKQYLLDVPDMQQSIGADFIVSEYQKKFYISAQDHNHISPQLFDIPEITEEISMGIKKIVENPNGILIQTRHQGKYALVDEMREHFNYEIETDSWGGPLNILEFSPKDIDKAYVLEYFLKALGISQDNLIAFGDGHSNTEMLSFAGTGCAMRDTSDILLPFADKRTEFSNEENGVTKELEKVFL